VLIINEEDTERLLYDRFKLLGASDAHFDLPIFTRVSNGDKLSKEYCETIRELCHTNAIQVVMFDSLRSLHQADENSSTEMQPILDNLKILSNAGITVVFTHHHKKQSAFDRSDNDAEASRGSSAINAAISGHISIKELEKEDHSRVLVVKHLKSKNTAKIDPFEIGLEISPESVRFFYGGEYEKERLIRDRAFDAVYEYAVTHPTKWFTIKHLSELKLGNEKYIRHAVKTMSVKGILSIGYTREDLEAMKNVPGLSGSRRELYYKFLKDRDTVVEADSLLADY
jgi:hypothetical protein